MLSQLDRKTFSTFVPDPFVTREDLLKMLLVGFGVASVADINGGRLQGASRQDLSYPLYEFLDSLVPLQAFAVLVVDEAQNLSLGVMEEIRILAELKKHEKLLQVVLVGQPELRDNLRLPQMRQVEQRVTVRCELAPLPFADVVETGSTTGWRWPPRSPPTWRSPAGRSRRCAWPPAACHASSIASAIARCSAAARRG